MKTFIAAPSLLSADKSKLKEEILDAEYYGARYLHWDVMDGKFVPNVSYSVEDVKKYAHIHHMVNDVHIMVSDPFIEAPMFIEAGADLLTFHIEAVNSLEEASKLIDIIHSMNCMAGISIKPKTAPQEIFSLLDKLDVVLVMSVEPGFGGQKFMNEAVDKIHALRIEIDRRGLKTLIEVDGGINEETAKLVKEAGVDILVAGSYVFGHEDMKERIKSLL